MKLIEELEAKVNEYRDANNLTAMWVLICARELLQKHVADRKPRPWSEVTPAMVEAHQKNGGLWISVWANAEPSITRWEHLIADIGHDYEPDEVQPVRWTDAGIEAVAWEELESCG